jgi:DNA-dependent RNA polymerase-like protein
LSKVELEPTINRILKARSSDNFISLNKAFPSIFKSYLNKSFGPYKRITKDNILAFKRLLLKKHPILIMKAKEDSKRIKEFKEQLLLKKAEKAKEEAIRIANFKFAFPNMKEKDIPSFGGVGLLDLELAKRRVLLEKEADEAAEAERIRLASILTKEEIQEKRIKELQEILNNSSVYLNDLDRLNLERELNRLIRLTTRRSNNNNNKNNNNKREFSTLTLGQKRNYHTTTKNSLNNFSIENKGKDVLSLLENKSLKVSVEDNETQIKLFSFLDYVWDVLNDETLNTYEKQTKIETEWMENIKIKLMDPEFSKTRLSIHITRAFNILNIQLGGKKSLKSINILSDDFKTFLIRIESLILAFGYIITYCSRMNYTYIASLIGNAIFWEYFRFYYKTIIIKNDEVNKLNPKTKNIYNYDLFYSENNFNEEQAVRLGDLLIECFIRIEIIDRRFDLEDKGKAYIEIRQDCINEIVENTFIVPTSLPMCHKPNEWSDDKRGGFLSNSMGKGEDLIQGSAKREKHLIENKKELFDSINYLDSIKFKINNDFLDFILNEGYYLLSLEDEKNWTQNLISIKIAQTFINTTFYINTFADWRGRIYTNSFFISYQGSNLAKNLIYFNEGEILNEKGFDYLYVYGANAYNENGLAKKSINERINWVQLNYQKILKMEKDFLINAKERFTFTAFCLVIKKLHQNHKAVINLPIFLDATCSGIQHLAALMKDLDSASRVNLIEQNNDEPVADIYSDVVGPVNEALNKFGLENMQTHSHFTRIKLTRKEIKPLVMTKPYNASIFGMTQQLANSFEITEKAKELLNKNYFCSFY